MKSKVVLGVVAALIVLGLAQSGYAQLQISVIGNPSPRETETTRAGEVNDPLSGNGIIITGTVSSDAYVTGGRLRIDWPTEITNCSAAIVPPTTSQGAAVNDCPSGAFPPQDPIVLSATTGAFQGAQIAAVDNVNGRIDITLPCGATAAGLGGSPGVNFTAIGTSGTIILTGVRLNLAGVAAPVNASISTVSSGTSGRAGAGCPAGVSVSPTNVILNTSSIESVTAVSPGIASVAVGARTGQVNEGLVTVFTNRTAADDQGSFVITEGHARAFFNDTTTQLTGAPADWPNDAGIRLTFSGIPSGMTLDIAVNSASSGTPVLSRTAITTANSTSDITWTTDLSMTTTDSVQINITGVRFSGSPTLTSASISVTATMFPVGGALDENNALITTSFPRFLDTQVGPATIASIIPANTTLLVPFALRDGAYDTGIALSNTTADPFTTAGGGATPQAGAVTLNFFPRAAGAAGGAGTTFSIVTTAAVRPGTGLSADGTLAAGATWTVLLSELLAQASPAYTGPFYGYIFIRTDFLHAHGAPFVSDFRNFTSFTPMLVLPNPAVLGSRLDDDSETEILGL